LRSSADGMIFDRSRSGSSNTRMDRSQACPIVQQEARAAGVVRGTQ
jgi:hypothetical protein